MKDLLEAITIMSKYTDSQYPTNCNHDIIVFNTIDVTKVSEEDIKRLQELGFEKSDEENDDADFTGFYSFRFGSN